MEDGQAVGPAAPAPVPAWHPIQRWLEGLRPEEWAQVHQRYLLARYGQLDPTNRRQIAAPQMTVIVFDGTRAHRYPAQALVEIRAVAADGSAAARAWALPAVFDQAQARISVPELEGRLCFTYTPDDAPEDIQQRAAEMLDRLQKVLIEYRRERARQRDDEIAEFFAKVGAAARNAIARVWAWGLRTYRNWPALVDHAAAIAAGAAVVTVLALTTGWVWGWPRLVYLIAIAAAFVTAVAATVARDSWRRGPCTKRIKGS